MQIVIPDDYQDSVRTLDCFAQLAGHEVVVYTDTVTDIEVLAQRFHHAGALVLIRERTAISAALLERLPNLKFISQTGRGIPHIDLAACTEHGVAVAVSGGSPYAPAELTWALVLAATRRIPQEVANLKAGLWQKAPLGIGLRGRTLGIFGYGSIGKLVAGYGQAFGMKVLVWGREGSLERAQADGLAVAISQRQFFEESDVLSLHLKLVKETIGIVTAADLGVMKPTALLVNTSRAGLIEAGALEIALSAGHPGWGAVDVFTDEPAVHDPLLNLPNALCTPHLGYVEKDSYELYFGGAFTNLLSWVQGNPSGVLNPEALHHSKLQ